MCHFVNTLYHIPHAKQVLSWFNIKLVKTFIWLSKRDFALWRVVLSLQVTRIQFTASNVFDQSDNLWYRFFMLSWVISTKSSEFIWFIGLAAKHKRISKRSHSKSTTIQYSNVYFGITEPNHVLNIIVKCLQTKAAEKRQSVWKRSIA